MAIEDIKKQKIGRELTEWVHLGINTGARHSVQQYRELKALGRNAEALSSLERATSMAKRAKHRIDKFIADYDAINGVSTGRAYLVECLALVGDVTINQITSNLTTQRAREANRVAANQAGGTLDDLALDIESNVPLESLEWVFPFEDDYTDNGLIDN